ncbi:MAG: hypothetical protein ACPGVO_20940 [Spirulinaceae cyanobacterium]
MLDLDIPSLTRHTSIPAIEDIKVDFNTFWKFSPTDGLKYLVAMRILGTQSQIKKLREHAVGFQLIGPLTMRFFFPINPLLLLTAISLSKVRREDFCHFLNTYVRGVEVPNLEDSLLRIDSACNEDELQQVLNLEDEYLKALLHVASKIVIEHGSIIQGRGTPTMCDLYWACWLVSNPAYQYESQAIPAEKSKDSKDSSINGWSRGRAWGWKYNSDIHNAREYYEHSLNQIESDLNQVLSKKPILDSDRLHLKALLGKQKILTRLVERSRRFYYWAPHEIGSFSFEMLIAGIGDRKFILPKEILNQLTLNISEEIKKHDNQEN